MTLTVHAAFDEVVGLDTGPRPPFTVDGYWLYLDSRPMIHVTRATQRRTQAVARRASITLRFASTRTANGRR